MATILATIGGVTDLAVLQAAVLHDTLEDTETTVEELEEHFGSEVRAIVEEVSDDKRLPKAERKRLQIEHAPHSSSKAKLVKLADKIANIRDVTLSPPAGWNSRRRREYLEWADSVVAGCRGVNPSLEAYYDHCTVAARRELGVESNLLGTEIAD